MVRIQIVGLPSNVYRRLREWIQAWSRELTDAVTVRSVPLMSRSSYSLDANAFNNIDRNVQDGFTHLLIAPVRNFRDVTDRYALDLRLVRLHLPSDLHRLSWDELRPALVQASEYEARWCRVAKPDDTNHPLLLPPPSFETHKTLGDFWNTCDCYGDTERLDAANSALQKAVQIHRKRIEGVRLWIDCRQRVFAVDRARHGRTLGERRGEHRYRFCYQIPPGFHYDVFHVRRDTFNLHGRGGTHNSIRGANVDSWGSVRPK